MADSLEKVESSEPSGRGATPVAPGRLALLEQDRDSLRRWFAEQHLPEYRADQILQWVYQKGTTAFQQMANLPKELRSRLAERLEILRASVPAEKRTSDGTRKLLLQWPDGASAECVLIPDRKRLTACLSTQAGCAVGCVFCASGLGGLERNLSAGEIVEQLLQLQSAAGRQNRITHVVLMGMGEPLANYDATVRAIRTIHAEWSFGLGARHITVSTVGLPRQIRRLAGEGLPVNLAISLHAPTDGLRRRLVPWAEKFKIADILAAADYYFRTTGREVTLEYVLLAGINDHMTQAQQLIKLAKRIRCSVNLIRYNPIDGLPFERPSSERTYAFQQALRRAKIPVKIRQSRGLKADAGCGQLRGRLAP